MYHFTIDGFRGFRSRFDDIKLVQEFLDEVPAQLGLQPVMPSFLLPYYNGVVPEDCGITSFVFLEGGHLTLHTFSFRETYFMDLLSPVEFDVIALRGLLDAAFPCTETRVNVSGREDLGAGFEDPRPKSDFGPHYMLEIEGYRGPDNLHDLFLLFDRLPGEVGMTPIMRPYVIHNRNERDGDVLSAITMIAESHITLHVFPEKGKAYFDLFSCSFFDHEVVLPRIREGLPGETYFDTLVSRGRDYRLYRTERDAEQLRSKLWLKSLPL